MMLKNLKLYNETCLHDLIPKKYEIFDENSCLKWIEDNYRKLC